ncbi:MAG: hypothetical protein IQL11_14575, partial [Bacteroidales bacterium]|nr:hypothetical protein [Bacteroidales bacterium]
MRKIFFSFFLTICSLVSARTYYVSPTGTDGLYPSRGTFANPWKSWHYAMNHTTGGDTCYFRGGVYNTYYSSRVGVHLADPSINGTYGHYTLFAAYPEDFAAGNKPILDCRGLTSTNNYNVGIEISRV